MSTNEKLILVDLTGVSASRRERVGERLLTTAIDFAESRGLGVGGGFSEARDGLSFGLCATRKFQEVRMDDALALLEVIEESVLDGEHISTSCRDFTSDEKGLIPEDY